MASAAGDNETAMDIYLNGKNAMKGAVFRTFLVSSSVAPPPPTCHTCTVLAYVVWIA
jgi:hypothetical protein